MDEEGEELENDDVHDVEEDNMAEMISGEPLVLERKASKTSTRSLAFHKKANLFAGARKNAETILSDGITYIEQYKAILAEMRAQEISKDQQLSEISLLSRGQDDSFRAVMSLFPPLFDDLSHRRAAAINDASVMLESHSSGRQCSRRRLILHAKTRLEDGLEQQRLATDATALIKHYKALLLS